MNKETVDSTPPQGAYLRRPGQPTKPGGKREKRLEVRIYDGLSDAVSEELKKHPRLSKNQLVIQSLQAALGVSPVDVEVGDQDDSLATGILPRRLVPFLGHVNCGTFEEATENYLHDAIYYDLGDLSGFIGAVNGDFLMQASGFSMVSTDLRRTIPDGALLLMRPGIEAEGQPALICIEMEDRPPLWTLKRYSHQGGTIRLSDGAGRKIVLDRGTRRVAAVAVVKRILDFGRE